MAYTLSRYFMRLSWNRHALCQIEIIGHYSYAESEMHIFLRVYCSLRPLVHCYACLSALISAVLNCRLLKYSSCLRCCQLDAMYRKFFRSSY
ncbi:Shaggy-related protein [Dirofilaria immitis]